MIGGDPGVFRADAARVRGWVDALESDAASLRRGDGVHWVGRAGDTFRRRMSDRAQDALATCGACEGYAAALDDLATTLESRQSQLAALVAEAGATMDEVRDAVVERRRGRPRRGPGHGLLGTRAGRGDRGQHQGRRHRRVGRGDPGMSTS